MYFSQVSPLVTQAFGKIHTFKTVKDNDSITEYNLLVGRKQQLVR